MSLSMAFDGSTVEVEPGSFRDREGRIFYYEGSVYRGLSETARHNWKKLSESPFFQWASETGKLVKTEEVEGNVLQQAAQDSWAAVLTHEKIPFVSYPYEWSFGMLKDAALLQLELLECALESDIILKDSTSFNIQWQGFAPVFIDIPSFEVLKPNEPWVGYRQFCQLFLYPLMLQAYKGVCFQNWLRGNIDGIEPGDFSQLMSLKDYLRPGVFSHVVLHSKLQASQADTNVSIKLGMQDAGFSKALIQANVRKLQALVKTLNLAQTKSEWAAYVKQHSYTDADMQRKEAFVRRSTKHQPRNLVWDLGANTGKFSRIAAESSRYVIAMDLDHLAVDYMYRSLKEDGISNILPLVMNVSQASPALGWQGKERKNLEQRGTPDLTLCLALIHHLVISANIRVAEFVEWLSGLETAVVIEFVTKQDPMVQKLLLNKVDHYADYEEGAFENFLSQYFDIVEKEVLKSGTRILYYAEPRR
jgi:ribosomal protein L11 methylase PrmA